MAKTPDAVRDLLIAVWQPARAARARGARRPAGAARGRGRQLRASRRGTGATTPRSCARRSYDFDEAELKPYLQLDKVIAAAFDVAGQLFGLTFDERTDAAGLSPGRARVGGDGRATAPHVGLFLGDYFARPSKRSGAWMIALPRPAALAGDVTPDRRQRDELRQGGGGPADAAHRSTTPARCSTSSATRCTALLSNVTYPLALRHQRGDATSSSCPRSSTSTG